MNFHDLVGMPLIDTGERQDPVPYNLKIYKGAKSYRLPRKFVDFLLNHAVAKRFLDWSKSTALPDEMVVPTLARISNLTKVDENWVVKQDERLCSKATLSSAELGRISTMPRNLEELSVCFLLERSHHNLHIRLLHCQ